MLAQGDARCISSGAKQISFSDFGQPVGMEMNPDNRWIKKADAIP